MASVHRRPRSPFWFAAWRDTHGKLFLRSTKQKEKSAALAAALDFERAEKVAGTGSLVESQTRKIVADIMERAGLASSDISIADWLAEWLKSKSGASEGTTQRYRIVIDQFLGYLGPRAKRPLSSLTGRDIQVHLDARTAEGVSSSTVRLTTTILRLALSAACKRKLITENPADALEMPKESRTKVERGVFTSDEVRRLVEAAEGEWRTVILLGYFTGARLGDCARMEWNAADLEKGILSFTPQKTGRPMQVPVHPDLLEHLRGLPRTEECISPELSGREIGGYNGLSRGFVAVAKKAGLDESRTFHSLRHSFTSALANADVAPELRMKLTGHASESVHRGYTHHELSVLRGAINKLPGL